MDPIFDRDGRTVGWRKRDVLYGLDGRARAFVANRAFFGLDGALLGRFEDGVYRDSRNRPLAFERGGTGAGVLPPALPSPVAPPPELRPPVPVFAAVPPAGIRVMTWSDRSWDEVLGGAPAKT